jgi:hypothetical protein
MDEKDKIYQLEIEVVETPSLEEPNNDVHDKSDRNIDEMLQQVFDNGLNKFIGFRTVPSVQEVLKDSENQTATKLNSVEKKTVVVAGGEKQTKETNEENTENFPYTLDYLSSHRQRKLPERLTLDFRADSSYGKPSNTANILSDHLITQPTKRRRSSATAAPAVSSVVEVNMKGDETEKATTGMKESPLEAMSPSAKKSLEDRRAAEKKKTTKHMKSKSTIEHSVLSTSIAVVERKAKSSNDRRSKRPVPSLSLTGSSSASPILSFSTKPRGSSLNIPSIKTSVFSFPSEDSLPNYRKPPFPSFSSPADQKEERVKFIEESLDPFPANQFHSDIQELQESSLFYPIQVSIHGPLIRESEEKVAVTTIEGKKRKWLTFEYYALPQTYHSIDTSVASFNSASLAHPSSLYLSLFNMPLFLDSVIVGGYLPCKVSFFPSTFPELRDQRWIGYIFSYERKKNDRNEEEERSEINGTEEREKRETRETRETREDLKEAKQEKMEKEQKEVKEVEGEREREGRYNIFYIYQNMMEIDEKFPFEFQIESPTSYNDSDYQMIERIQITLNQQHDQRIMFS